MALPPFAVVTVLCLNQFEFGSSREAVATTASSVSRCQGSPAVIRHPPSTDPFHHTVRLVESWLTAVGVLHSLKLTTCGEQP